MARTKQTAVKNAVPEARKKPRADLTQKAKDKVISDKGVVDAEAAPRERKKPRLHAGTRALREIISMQKPGAKMCIPRASFGRLVREIAEGVHPGLRWQRDALERLKVTSEDVMTEVFRQCEAVLAGAAYVKRKKHPSDPDVIAMKKTVTPRTMKAVRYIMSLSAPHLAIGDPLCGNDIGFITPRVRREYHHGMMTNLNGHHPKKIEAKAFVPKPERKATTATKPNAAPKKVKAKRDKPAEPASMEVEDAPATAEAAVDDDDDETDTEPRVAVAATVAAH